MGNFLLCISNIVQRCVAAAGKPRGCTLYVTNCPDAITLTELKDFFSILGDVSGVVRGEYVLSYPIHLASYLDAPTEPAVAATPLSDIITG